MLDDEQPTILKVIGEQNTDCIKVLKYIVNSQNSTPINSQMSNAKNRHNYTPST